MSRFNNDNPIGMKVGTKVRIRDLRLHNKAEPPAIIFEMHSYRGRTATIKSVNEFGWMSLDTIPYYWISKWLKPIGEET